jgi:uncharacterized protein DUF3311
MSTHESPTRAPARPGPYVVSGILIAIAIILPLLVPIYARWDPALFGIPFFYWYQMLWVLIDAGLLWICYAIMTKEDNRRRAQARQGEPGAAASPDDSTAGER